MTDAFDPTILDRPPRDDGGPAFPRSDGGYSTTFDGMTLRDYFAAHAPRKRASWFTPTMPPKPEAIWDHEHPTEVCYLRDCQPVNFQERFEWTVERQRQYELQWPYAWADAMIAQRKVGG
jgi:hypothetical protein